MIIVVLVNSFFCAILFPLSVVMSEFCLQCFEQAVVFDVHFLTSCAMEHELDHTRAMFFAIDSYAVSSTFLPELYWQILLVHVLVSNHSI